MERKAKVELFEQIRREYEFGEGNNTRHRAPAGGASADGAAGAGQCRIAGSASNGIREATDNGAVDAIQHRGDSGSRSQRPAQAKRHTAHRIWQRMATEQPERRVSEVHVIRQYVRERKRELGWSARAISCVPQSYVPGQEGQVDWYGGVGGAQW